MTTPMLNVRFVLASHSALRRRQLPPVIRPVAAL
ncbi:MAG: hypothetical protein QOG80_2404 [Pseudonocardiales bacterium]|nr:hypothetical protein [Pseudonocardiales bacterium]